jgi:hypothetical protein
MGRTVSIRKIEEIVPAAHCLAFAICGGFASKSLFSPDHKLLYHHELALARVWLLAGDTGPLR